MLNIADKDQVRDAARAEKREAERADKDFRAIMESPYGRRFIARTLNACGFQRSSFTGNSTTFFNEGRRSIALELWADINRVAPDLYVQMLNDAQEQNA
jgi:hypothetical protein